MSSDLYLPPDEFSDGSVPDLDLAADYLELKAAFSPHSQAFSQDIVDALELTAETEYVDVDNEIRQREEVATGAVARMARRKRVLEGSYPFEIDDEGDMVLFIGENPDPGQTAYLVSLVLSNLRWVSPLMATADLHPTRFEVDLLRKYFQYLSTVAIAGEVGGPAWSFGYPRPDGSRFLTKLTEIWATLKDGKVRADPSAPLDPKDDQIDIFAWRQPKDGLPGFLLVAAQVATGRNWREKSIRAHVDHVFRTRWFGPEPVTVMVAYHVIPFARPDEKFRDDVLVLGNVLHRLRVPSRVNDAADLVLSGVKVEAFDRLSEMSDWVQTYLERARAS